MRCLVDYGDDRVMLLEGGEGLARIKRLRHGGAPLVSFDSAESATTLTARPHIIFTQADISSILTVRTLGRCKPVAWLCLTPFSSCGAEASSFDAVSAALPPEAAEVAASRNNSNSYHNHSHRNRLSSALVFGRAVVVQHFPCRRHRTSPN